MATRAQQTKVGLFLVICLAAIVAGLVLVSGRRMEVRVPYWIEFEESVLGLGQGATVEYLGVPVGTVENIFVTPDGHAHVDILVSTSKVTLHKGVQAKTVMPSLATGLLYISLTGGDPSAPVLPANSQIPATKSLIVAVSSRAEELLDSLMKIGKTIESGLEGMQPGELNDILINANLVLEDGRTFVENTDATVSSLKIQLEAALYDFQNLTAETSEVARGLRDTNEVIRAKIENLGIKDTQEKVDEALSQVSTLAERLGKTVETLDKVAQSSLHEIDNVEYEMRETLRTATETMQSVRSLADSLQQDPAQLLRGKGKPTGDR